MARLLLLVLLGFIACRMMAGRWPWQLWRISERTQKEAMARSLLGISRAASRDDIIAAHRALIVRVHPDRGGTSAQVHAADAARDLLLARIADQQRASTG